MAAYRREGCRARSPDTALQLYVGSGVVTVPLGPMSVGTPGTGGALTVKSRAWRSTGP
jgi:hypothetical protein